MSDQGIVSITHFVLDARIGGPHNYIRALMQKSGESVISRVVTSGRGPMTDIALLNIRRIWSPLYALEVVINVLLILVLALRGIIPRQNAVFAVHGVANTAPLIAARLLQMPVAWYIHETWERLRIFSRIGQLILGRSRHRVVGVTSRIGESYGFSQYEVIPPAIDCRFWAPAPVDAAPERAPARVWEILTVGNLNHLKGHDLLLESLAGFPHDYHLQIVGAALANQQAYSNRLRTLAARTLSNRPHCRIEFVGWKEKEDIRSLLQHCDLFVLPSRSEGCPVSLLEAMAAARVCVVADVGGVRDVIPDSGHGLVFEAGNVASLRNALLEAGQLQHSQRQDIGRRARMHVMKNNDVTALADRHYQLYCELLTQRTT